ncbi:MAG: hypothetical protein ACLUIE_16545 [Parabacteroides merdae]
MWTRHTGILVAINAEKILHATEQTRANINRNIGYCGWSRCTNGFKAKVIKMLKILITQHYYRYTKSILSAGGKPQINETAEKLRSEYQDIQQVIVTRLYQDG